MRTYLRTIGLSAVSFFAAAAAMLASDRRPDVANGHHEQAGKGKQIMATGKGTFDVKLTPLEPHDKSSGPFPGRMFIDKQFHGDMEGTSKGEMLAFMSEVKGSAGYVAMERVTATLHGRTGTFVFQHSATMDHGEGALTVTVVPDSGTGELKGLTGKLDIKIENGKHLYTFDYTLPLPEVL